jgi:hypothetical protein
MPGNVEGSVLKPSIGGNVFGNQPDPIKVTRQLPGNYVTSPEIQEDWLGQ